ncbi:MAG: hypothetical protein LBD15_01645 [Holosporales bacterium]|jgi:hypothetical protein|nr:hypothetical protein [Holosporales bacterium]
MIDLTAKFLDFVEKENALLNILQIRSVQNLRTSKETYLSDYTRLSVLLQKEQKSQTLDPEKWNRLRRLNRLFSEAVQENYRLFAALEHTSRHLLEATHQELALLEIGTTLTRKPSKRLQRPSPVNSN